MNVPLIINYHLNTLERKLVIEGSKNGLVKYSTTIYFNDPHDTTWYDFEYIDIDSLIFKSSEYIVVDNFTFRDATITIDDILTFFDQSVANDTLTGYGHGNSANNRLDSLRNKLQMASDLIDIGDIDGACVHLDIASDKCDRVTPPPDFVKGESATILHDMILELMAELGCE